MMDLPMSTEVWARSQQYWVVRLRYYLNVPGATILSGESYSTAQTKSHPRYHTASNKNSITRSIIEVFGFNVRGLVRDAQGSGDHGFRTLRDPRLLTVCQSLIAKIHPLDSLNNINCVVQYVNTAGDVTHECQRFFFPWLGWKYQPWKSVTGSCLRKLLSHDTWSYTNGVRPVWQSHSWAEWIFPHGSFPEHIDSFT